jgi:glycosyltransferase involved in cell wall biosynthesis
MRKGRRKAFDGRYLLDAYDLGINTKGVDRVLRALVAELRSRGTDLLIATTDAGAGYLGRSEPDVVVVPRMKKSIWEQWGLPRTARRLGCVATYSFREAGALWGPPLVLHVPEDPEVRWTRTGAADLNDRARRVYSRVLMRKSLRRAAIVAACVRSVNAQLTVRYDISGIVTIPLGVDCQLFYPTPDPSEDFVFHLGSEDPRDRTLLVLRSYVAAARRLTIPPLIIGGWLGDALCHAVNDEIARSRLKGAVRLVGRVSDHELADLYRNAFIVVQPASDEGFGLQPLEALASGAPLLVASTPAVREIVDGAAMVVEAHGEAFSTGLSRLSRDQHLRGRLREAGPPVAASFSWGRSADLVLDSLGRVAAGGGSSRV